jgi:hypothetical protein
MIHQQPDGKIAAPIDHIHKKIQVEEVKFYFMIDKIK